MGGTQLKNFAHTAKWLVLILEDKICFIIYSPRAIIYYFIVIRHFRQKCLFLYLSYCSKYQSYCHC